MKFTVPGYRAQDIEFDDVTFAPKCALDEPGDQHRAGPGLPGAVRQRSDLQVQRERARPRRNCVLHCGRPGDPLPDCVEPPRHRPDRRHLHLYVHLLRAALVRRGNAEDLRNGEQRHLREPAHGHRRHIPVAPTSKPRPRRSSRRSTVRPSASARRSPTTARRWIPRTARSPAALTWFLDGVPWDRAGRRSIGSRRRPGRIR